MDQQCDRRTNKQTDGQTDRQTEWPLATVRCNRVRYALKQQMLLRRRKS